MSIAAAGMAMFSSSALNALGTEESAFPGYKPNAPEGNDLRTPLSTTRTVRVHGKLFNRDTMVPLANQPIEVWHLSPGGKNYDHRGTFFTDADGSYTFLTDMPDKLAGKMPRINFRVSSNNDSYLTSLIIGTEQAFILSDHWERNRSLGSKLQPKRKEELGQTSIQFNISI